MPQQVVSALYNPANARWSAHQYQQLHGLGYTVFGLRGIINEKVNTVASPSSSSERKSLPSSLFSPSQQRSVSPQVVPPASSPTATTSRRIPTEFSVPEKNSRTTPVTRRAGLKMPDRLQMAILRASGFNPNLPSTQEWLDQLPLSKLRGNSAAKRAFWIELRALRKNTN